LILDLILDTNALSAVADDEVSAVKVFKTADSIALPVVVLGEYRFGILGSRRRTDYEKWLRELISLTNVLEIDEQTSEHYARIRMELKQAGHPIPSNDLWIAALCLQHALPLLSRDRHFDWIHDLQRIEW
jgi:tRNA(fMet)-specific endonuclease VapC